MSDKLKMIPLCHLRHSKFNVRRTDRKADIAQLAASILAEGLLQNLVVHPDGGENSDPVVYAVDAGGRRLSALKLLAKRKKIASDFPVRCLVRESAETDVIAASLAENFARVELHPADQFLAFAELHKGGLPLEDVAARYRVTATFVQQRLKLAAVSPRLIAEYRAGSMTLEQLAAFTLTDDHALQERVWFENPYGGLSAQTIRQHVTVSQVEAWDGRARFIGSKAYEAAGGVIVRDLFDEEDDGYFADSALLDRLVAERLTAEAEQIRQEGWAWVEVLCEWDGAALAHYDRLEPSERRLSEAEEAELERFARRYDDLVAALEEDGGDTEELDRITAQITRIEAGKETWTEEQRSQSGTVVSLDSQGSVRVFRGLVRPVTNGAEHRSGQEPSKSKRRDGYSEAVLLELSVQKTAALREIMASRPELAITVLLHCLIRQLFFGDRSPTCLDINASEVSLSRLSDGIETSKAGQLLEARRVVWKERLPDEGHLLVWLAALDQSEQLQLLAFCLGLTVNALESLKLRRATETDKQALVRLAGLDMTHWWCPTRANFLDRLTKKEILAAVSEGASEQAARRLDGEKKDRLAAKAEELLAKAAWLPMPLRTSVETD